MDDRKSDATFIEHTPCPSCGSSDANSLYDDGHQWCFACETYTPPEGERQVTQRESKGLEPAGDFVYLRSRKITEDVCKKFNYSVRDGMHIAPYYDSEGRVVAQKIRKAGKQFHVVGSLKEAGLFGEQLFKKAGKRLVITEGELDALSVYRMMPNWPVVSVPNGASGARKAIQKSIEFVESYDSVVFCFDNDEVGRKAAQECAELLTPGKAKIATLPLKDASEMLVADRTKEFTSCIWEAKEIRPDGIVNLADSWDLISTPVEMGVAYPWEPLTKTLYGLRTGEIVTLCAGSGVGKSAIAAEIAYKLLIDGERVGYIALEEGVRRTGLRFLGMHLNVPLHLPGYDVDEETKRQAFKETLGTGRMFSYDHFGSLEGDNLLSKLRFLAKGCGVKWIILDHLSIVVSGMTDDEGERKAIDVLMTKLRSFVEETGVGMILVSHLKRPPGTAHEEGGKVSLAQLRGSASIGQLSDVVLGVERDQQGEDADDRNISTIRLLKFRLGGTTGVVTQLEFNPETHRLLQHGDTGGDVGF